MKKIHASIVTALISIGAISQPTITNFSPSTGSVGTTVTLTGTNFNAVASNNIVFFGAAKASISSASTTSITVTVPVGATYEDISITDMVTSLTGYSNKPFIVSFSGCGLFDSTMFAPKIDFTTAINAKSITICDLNEDGKADMATANNNTVGSISFFQNTGTPGTLSFAPKVNIQAGALTSDLEHADIDGDGKQDIVAGNNTGNAISVFRNISTLATIALEPKIDFTTGYGTQYIEIGDIDADGKPDIITANSGGGGVSILRNTSSPGSISFATKVDFSAGVSPTYIAVGDIDGDGKPEVAVANYEGTISLHKNTSVPGTISFGPVMTISIISGSTPYVLGFAMGDMDGDNKLDFIATRGGSDCSYVVFRNTSTPGNVSFAPMDIFYVYPFCSWIDPRGVQVGDLDGDGKLDVALNSIWENETIIYKNTSTVGNLSFGPGVEFEVGYTNINLAIGDLDGDGLPEIAVVNSHTASQSISVLRNLQCTASIGLFDELKTDIVVYPNPFSSVITITKIENESTIEVFNVLGGKVISVQSQNTSVELNLSELESGIYFINVSSEKGVVSKKIVKE